MKRALILSGGGARGAFQVGVWKYLRERNWAPDLISGSSIGAINAAAIVSQIPVAQLINLWTSQHRSKLYRLQLLKFLAAALFKKPLRPMLDTERMRSVLSSYVDIPTLRQSSTELIVTAVNISTGRLHLFNNREINIDHLVASGAMPILFPWQTINGEPYWDGGVMANAPLFTALERGAEEIIVVLLTPVGHVPQPFPGTFFNSLELVFEHFLSGSYQTTLSAIHQTLKVAGGSAGLADKQPQIRVVAPSRMLGLRSLLNFSSRQAHQLVDHGYRNAREQLQSLI